MANISTYNALLARGFNSDLIGKITEKGLNLSKLQQLNDSELSSLGIPLYLINNLKGSRPPIPEATIVKLLHESKSVCCICRNQTSGVVVHHIEEWSLSHNHNESNLVLLCPNHHNEAHTQRDLSLNLTKQRLIASKTLWIKEVKQQDKNTILNIITNPNANWSYFNHGRIFELYIQNNVSNNGFRVTNHIKQLGLIDLLGVFPILNNHDRMCFYNFQYGIYLRYYMHEILCHLMAVIPFVDITSKFTKNAIKHNIAQGQYVTIQAAFYFRQISKQKSGLGQQRIGYYKKRNVKVEFTIDPYECTSVSAYCCHLAGHKVATVIGRVISILEDNGTLIITLSCLGIGCYMDMHEYRETKQYQGYQFIGSEYDYEESQ